MNYTKKIVGILVVIILLLILTLSISASESVEYEYIITNNEITLTKYTGNKTKLTIPQKINGYKVVGLEGTFSDNDSIKRVVIPEGITTIGSKTFYNCSSLQKVSIPSTTYFLGDYAFAYSNIKKIVLSENIHFVNIGCFYGCSQLKMVESKASPTLLEQTALHLEQYAFAYSDLRVIKTKYTPSYYDNTFTTNCIFSDNNLTCLIFECVAPTLITFIQTKSPLALSLLAALAIFSLGLIIIFIIYVSRKILSLLGKNNISNYNKYSKQIFSEIGCEKSVNNIIHCKKITFSKDNFIKILNIFSIVCYTFLYFVLLFYTSSIVQIDLGIKNPFLRAAITVFGIIFITISLIWIGYKIKSFLSDHKKHANKPHIRIRRIGRGGKNNDQ